MIEFITYQGEKYPVRVSYYALNMAAKETDSELESVQGALDAQPALLWYGLVSGHQAAKKELTLKKEDIEWILDECYIEFQKILLVYNKAIIDMQNEVLKDYIPDKKK